MRVFSKARQYHEITKPGIIKANLLTACAGFLFGSQGNVEFWALIGIILGTYLCIASGCVFNNYMDKHRDAKMERTKHRHLVTGQISESSALVFASVLGLSGAVVLLLLTNFLTFLVGMLALFFYVVVYGLAKRYTNFGTEVGSVPGAASILAGYTAATNSITKAGLVLFICMILWQMPHFYSISIFRMKEYARAGIPTLPKRIGEPKTRYWILGYILLYLLATESLSFIASASYIYAVGMFAAGVYWLYKGFSMKHPPNYSTWARDMFNASLLVLLVFSTVVSLEGFI